MDFLWAKDPPKDLNEFRLEKVKHKNVRKIAFLFFLLPEKYTALLKSCAEGARNFYPLQLHIFWSVTYIFGVLKPVTYIELHRFPDEILNYATSPPAC